MPWMETDAMNERLRFLPDTLTDRFTMAEICARYGRRSARAARARAASPHAPTTDAPLGGAGRGGRPE